MDSCQAALQSGFFFVHSVLTLVQCGWLEKTSTTGIGPFPVMVFLCFLFGAGIPSTSFYICWMRLMDVEGLEIQDEDEVNWECLEQGGFQ